MPTLLFNPHARHPLSVFIDLINIILYLNSVMSSWCVRDLHVAGQMPALSISGVIFTGSSLGEMPTVLMGGPMGNYITWFACCTVSASISCENLCGCALLLTIEGRRWLCDCSAWSGLEVAIRVCNRAIICCW
jgi:hypothetical protein